MKDYQIICDEDWTVVETKVNELVAQSFYPLGAPFVFTQKDDKGEDQQLFCQAVIRSGLVK